MIKTIVSLFVAARLYLLLVPCLFQYTGAGLNQVVIAANGDRFPVLVNDQKLLEKTQQPELPPSLVALLPHVKLLPGMIDDTHCLMTKDTRLNFLGDWIDLHFAIVSPGDLLIVLSGVLWDYAPTVWMTLLLNDLLIYAKKHEEKN